MSETLKSKSNHLSPGQAKAYKKKSPNKSKSFLSTKSKTEKSINGSKPSETISVNTPNSSISPIRNPFLVKQKKSLKKKKKKKKNKFKSVQSFDDRLKPHSVSKRKKSSKIEEQFIPSIEEELNKNRPRKNSLPNNGILRHKSWKKVRRSVYSMAMKEKKNKLDNSSNSKTSTIDSLGLNNKFNKSKNSIQEEEDDIDADTGRKDQFKNPIIRGKKRHKVSFARKSVTIDVENWKKLNLKLAIKPNKNKGCLACSIF
jgi:hypothetical protein